MPFGRAIDNMRSAGPQCIGSPPDGIHPSTQGTPSLWCRHLPPRFRSTELGRRDGLLCHEICLTWSGARRPRV